MVQKIVQSIFYPMPEKNKARGKTGQKNNKLNIELFVMLNLRS